MLGILLRRVNLMYNAINQPYLATLFTMMLCTAYYGLFRISEIAFTGSGHTALARNVHIAKNKDKFLFILESSKTHRKGSKPQLIKITQDRQPVRSGSRKHKSKTSIEKAVCPYHLLRKYSGVRPPYVSDNEQFFVLSDGTAVSAVMLRNSFKTAIRAENFDAQLYSFHSLRAGRAGDMLKLGLSIETIKKLGHWKSNAVFRYLRWMGTNL